MKLKRANNSKATMPTPIPKRYEIPESIFKKPKLHN